MRFGRGLARSAGGVWVRKPAPAGGGTGVTVDSVAATAIGTGIGEDVDITGTGFADGDTVLIDGVTVTSKTRTGTTKWQATIPSGVTPGLVPVTVNGVTLTNAFTAYAAPDIINAGFETGWDGWQNYYGGTPDDRVTRVTTQAKQGSYSVLRDWNEVGVFAPGLWWRDPGDDITSVYLRLYFRHSTGTHDSSDKVISFWNWANRILMCKPHKGTNQFKFYDRVITEYSPDGTIVINADTWYALEIHFDNANSRFRAWLDGTQLTFSSSEWRSIDDGTDPISRVELIGYVNEAGSGRCSTFVDRAAISTQQTGP